MLLSLNVLVYSNILRYEECIIDSSGKYVNVVGFSNVNDVIAINVTDKILFKPLISFPTDISNSLITIPGKGSFKYYTITKDSSGADIENEILNSSFIELSNTIVYIRLLSFSSNIYNSAIASYYAFYKDLYIEIIEVDDSNFTTAAYPDIRNMNLPDMIVNSNGVDVRIRNFKPGFRLYMYASFSQAKMLESYGLLKTAYCTYLLEEFPEASFTSLEKRISRSQTLASGHYFFMFDVTIATTDKNEFFYFRQYNATITDYVSVNAETLIDKTSGKVINSNGAVKLFIPYSSSISVYMEPFYTESPLENGDFYDVQGPLNVECRSDNCSLYTLNIQTDIYTYKTIISSIERTSLGSESIYYWVFPDTVDVSAQKTFALVFDGLNPKINTIGVYNYDSNNTLYWISNSSQGIYIFDIGIFGIIYNVLNSSDSLYNYKSPSFELISFDYNENVALSPMKPSSTQIYQSLKNITKHISTPQIIGFVHSFDENAKIVFNNSAEEVDITDFNPVFHSSNTGLLSVHMKNSLVSATDYPNVPISTITYDINQCDRLDILYDSKPYWFGSNSPSDNERNATILNDQTICVWMISFNKTTYSINMSIGEDSLVSVYNGDETYKGVNYSSILVAPVLSGTQNISTKKAEQYSKSLLDNGVNADDVDSQSIFVVVNLSSLESNSHIIIQADSSTTSTLNLPRKSIQLSPSTNEVVVGNFVPSVIDIKDDKLNGGEIAAISIGIIAVLSIISGVVLFIIFKNKKKMVNNDDLTNF